MVIKNDEKSRLELKLTRENLRSTQKSIREMKKKLNSLEKDIIKAKKKINIKNVSKNKKILRQYFIKILKLEQFLDKIPKLR